MNKIERLKNASSEELGHLYQELFNSPPSSINQLFVSRKIAYKLQENEAGGFPKDLAEKIKQLVKDIDPINMTSLRCSRPSRKHQIRDQRLPIPGTIITKKYKDQLIEVKVLDKGFEYKGKQYRSLTAISEEITKSHWSGFDFFELK